MQPNLRFHGHACLSLEDAGGGLLQDPWLEGEVFNNSWSLLIPPNLEAIDFGHLRSIWISHEHPDHLHFGSLHLIRNRVTGPLRLFFRKQKNPNVRDALAKLGFEVVELAPHQTVRLSKSLSITSFPEEGDTALVIEANGRVVLNQNDCRLSRNSLSLLRKRFPRIDAWFFQFSLAAYHANPDNPAGLAQAKRTHLRLIRDYFEVLEPFCFVPFASFIRFSKQGNAYMNDWRVTLDDVTQGLADLPIQVLWPGDLVLWQDWEARNSKNLPRWRTIYQAPQPAKPHALIQEQELLQTGSAMVKRCRRGPWVFRPPELHLQIKETGRALSLDLRRGKARLLQAPHPKQHVATLPSEELLYLLKYPWGIETVNIGAFPYVVKPFHWRWLSFFVHLLYRIPEERPWSELLLPIARTLGRYVWNQVAYAA